jgi:predicted Fe-S protein YdhL (DUF1289 family)
MSDFYLGIESQMMNPPKPMCVGVFRANREIVAWLSIDQLREVVERWDQMEAARQQQTDTPLGR